MRRTALALSLGISLGTVLASRAAAQRPLAAGLAGGVTVRDRAPAGDARAGWHALGTIALSSPTQPLGLRLDAAYARFALADDGRRTVASATLNVTYRLPTTDSPLSPYVVTGAGAYRTACGAGCGASTRSGWNAGLGTRLYAAGVRAFVEARYHRPAGPGASRGYVPVTVGLLL